MIGSNRKAAGTGARKARTYKMAPVARAVRAALAVSATTLALTASGAVFAADTHVHVPSGNALFWSAAQHDAAGLPVVDLTVVDDRAAPSSVTGAGAMLTDDRWSGIAGSADAAGFAPTSGGDIATLGAVQDLTAIGGLSPGPGGASGTDDSIYFDGSGITSFYSNGGVFSATPSAAGFADFVFANSSYFTHFVNNADISVTGYTWAAGMEIEADTYAHDIRNSSTGAITASATGAYGQAWGIYAVAADDVDVYNDGIINVTASGYAGTATGLFAYSPDGTASASNTGGIAATASGDYGQAWGIYVAGDGLVSASNTNSITAAATGVDGEAIGISAYSAYGDASIDNAGNVRADASYYGTATGILGQAYGNLDLTNSFSVQSYAYFDAVGLAGFAGGDIAVDNSGDIRVTSRETATGILIDAVGNASIDNTGAIYANAWWNDARGIVGYASGDLAVDNSGLVRADSTYGNAVGILAYASGDVDVGNTSYVYANAWGDDAVGIFAAAEGNATVGNDGVIVAASRNGNATGVFGYAVNGDVALDNTVTGYVDAYSYAGMAIGLYGYSLGGDVSIVNAGEIDAFSNFGLADGIFTSGANVNVGNTGQIDADGYDWAAGIEAQGDNSATVGNSGAIYVAAYMDGGQAFGIYATGGIGGVAVDNAGTIGVGGDYADGIFVESAGPVTVANSGDIYAGSFYGSALATGIQATSTGTGSNITVDNSGNIGAYGYFGATGIEVLANDPGTGNAASIVNSGTIYAGQYNWYGYGAAGVVAQADGDAGIDNSGSIVAVSGGMAYGALALSFNGDATVTNSGDIAAYSTKDYYYYGAYGIVAASTNGAAQVDNSGHVLAVSDYNGGNVGIGVQASAGTGATVTNSGAITTDAWYAYGVSVSAGLGDAVVTNTDTGVIDVSGGEFAFGVLDIATDSTARVDNAGAIATQAYGQSVGVFGLSYGGDATVDNSGEVTAYSAFDIAVGIFGRADYGTAVVDNSGLATGFSYYGDAIGVFARSGYGTAAVDNSGLAAGYSNYGDGIGISTAGAITDVTNTGAVYGMSTYGDATGIQAYGYAAATITNEGLVGAGSKYGDAQGVYAISGGDVTVGNGVDGLVAAYAPEGVAIGTLAYSFSGDTTVANAGAMGALGYYVAIGAYAGAYGDAQVDNSGTISAMAYGSAAGAQASSYGGDVAVVNSGSIDAYAYVGTALGVNADSYYGSVSVTNTDTGAIEALSAYGYAYGVYAVSGGDTTVDNAGTISAQGYDGAIGVYAAAYGSVAAVNSGSIAAISYGSASGIIGIADDGVSLGNAASGTVEATSTEASAYGMAAISYLGDIVVDNAGMVHAQADDTAFGVFAVSGYGDIGVANSGAIAAESTKYAHGINVRSQYGAVTVDNAGTVSALGEERALGIYAAAYGDVAVTNSGDVAADSLYGDAIGMRAFSYQGELLVDNSGGLAVYTPYGAVHGIQAYASNGAVVVDNGGAIAVETLYGDATGITAYAGVGNVGIDNSGSIVADAGTYGEALGIGVYAYTGDIGIDNSGSILADAEYDDATGIDANAYTGDIGIGNSGSIAVSSTDDDATGIEAEAYAGDIAIGNSGSIAASSTYDAATGIEGMAYAGDVALGNTASGTIAAYSAGGQAAGMRAYSGYGSVVIDNAGAVSAQGYAAVGLQAMSAYGSVIDNSGAIASDSDYLAMGAVAVAKYGDAQIVSSGSVTVAAGDAYGLSGIALDGDAGVDNSGSIEVVGGDGAMGAMAMSVYGSASVINSGSIDVSVDTGGYVVGVAVSSPYGQSYVDNSGTIAATGVDYAVGVQMYAALSTLYNSGTIQTYADNEGRIAVLGSAGVDQILNAGDIHGAIMTDAGDDLLVGYSGGTWHVDNRASDFGAGDDSIYNLAGSTIHLTDGAIYLGSSTAAGNIFDNSGTVLVSGDSLIDMGSGVEALPLLPGQAQAMAAQAFFTAAAVPSLNAEAFVNDGLIDFVDGAPDDMLTIVGDFAGSGTISLDVSTLNGTSDVLYVDGSIVDGTVQTVDAHLDAFPTLDSAPIPFVYVSGDSNSGAFVAGQVLGAGADPSNFLNLGLVVTSQLDASNASADVFSFGVTAAGLNDTGVLAASIGPGAHSLINSQIGTWRQRVGVMPTLDDGRVGLSPWIRVFSDKGEVDPQHSTDFGDASDFRFDQDNWGRELGINFTMGNGVHYGVLLGKSDGKQRLLGGVGSDRIEMDTAGLYATWVGDRFYVDASYRWMDFDATLASAAGRQTSSGNATAFNVEAGWTAASIGGVDVTPQAQYTRSSIDNIDAVQGESVQFQPDGGVSERARLGVAFGKAFQSGGVLWTPYGSVNAVREFKGDNAFTVADDFHGATRTEGTSAMLELGMGAQKGGVSVTGGINWTDGGALNSFFGGQLVLRYTW